MSFVRKVQNVNNQYGSNTNSPAAQAAFSHAADQFLGQMLLLGVVALAVAYDWLQHGLWGKRSGSARSARWW